MTERKRARSTTRTAPRWVHEYRVLLVDQLFVDDRYQRPVSHFADQIVGDWNPMQVGALIVAERADGTFAVVDGQHRLAAARTIGERFLPCVVLREITLEQEAELFAKLQTERRNVRPTQRFRAEVVAGKPRAVFIARELERRDIELTQTSGRMASANSLAAIAALESVYDRDPDTLVEVLDLLVAAWPQTRGRFANELIRGVAAFLFAHPQADRPRLLRALEESTPEEIGERSTNLRKGVGMGGASAVYTRRVIEALYNKGLPGRRRLKVG